MEKNNFLQIYLSIMENEKKKMILVILVIFFAAEKKKIRIIIIMKKKFWCKKSGVGYCPFVLQEKFVLQLSEKWVQLYCNTVGWMG